MAIRDAATAGDKSAVDHFQAEIDQACAIMTSPSWVREMKQMVSQLLRPTGVQYPYRMTPPLT